MRGKISSKSALPVGGTVAEDAEKYKKAVELADAIVRRIGGQLSSALERVGSPDLVKGALDKPRVKSLASIARKAKDKGWSVEETIEKCWDFVGFRVVCNNLQDLYRAADLFQQALQEAGLKTERHDHIEKPQRSGYRAIHIICPVKVGFGGDEMTLGCEIQIRTRLQDAWGHLSREELYRKNVPPSLVDRMRELAETLARADVVAEEIRVQVTKPRKGEKPAADAPLTAPAIAFIFNRAFGGDPPDYLVEATLQKTGEKKVRADALDALLQDKTFREKLDAAYLEQTKWSPYPARIFECAVHAALNGTASGIALARKQGKADWAEIDAQFKSEISYAVPETWAELKRRLENRQAEIGTIAEYFDATDTCACTAEIVEFDSLVSSVIEHYGLEDKEASEASDLLIAAMDRAGMDDSEGTGLCSYCYHVLNKDD
jgi:ppGpp synthetase/RelA/SpoT-type nucleotidyltranferase